MAVKKLVQVDVSLVHELEKLSTGATVHRINNLLAVYKGFVQCWNDIGQHFDKVEEAEIQIRKYIFEQRRLTFSTASV